MAKLHYGEWLWTQKVDQPTTDRQRFINALIELLDETFPSAATTYYTYFNWFRKHYALTENERLAYNWFNITYALWERLPNNTTSQQ